MRKILLVAALAARPQAFSVLAYAVNPTDSSGDGDMPVGLVNCIEGFSTFACRPLVNVHDVAVLASHRGQRVAAQMLQLAEVIALQRGACKLTLEVLSGNRSAIASYQRFGFTPYQLDPALGNATFFKNGWGETPGLSIASAHHVSRIASAASVTASTGSVSTTPTLK